MHNSGCQCYLCRPSVRTPSPFSCCGEIICRYTEEISSINTEEYQRAWEEESNYSFNDFREYNDITLKIIVNIMKNMLHGQCVV